MGRGGRKEFRGATRKEAVCIISVCVCGCVRDRISRNRVKTWLRDS